MRFYKEGVLFFFLFILIGMLVFTTNDSSEKVLLAPEPPSIRSVVLNFSDGGLHLYAEGGSSRPLAYSGKWLHDGEPVSTHVEWSKPMQAYLSNGWNGGLGVVSDGYSAYVLFVNSFYNDASLLSSNLTINEYSSDGEIQKSLQIGIFNGTSVTEGFLTRSERTGLIYGVAFLNDVFAAKVFYVDPNNPENRGEETISLAHRIVGITLDSNDSVYVLADTQSSSGNPVFVFNSSISLIRNFYLPTLHENPPYGFSQIFRTDIGIIDDSIYTAGYIPVSAVMGMPFIERRDLNGNLLWENTSILPNVVDGQIVAYDYADIVKTQTDTLVAIYRWQHALDSQPKTQEYFVVGIGDDKRSFYFMLPESNNSTGRYPNSREHDRILVDTFDKMPIVLNARNFEKLPGIRVLTGLISGVTEDEFFISTAQIPDVVSLISDSALDDFGNVYITGTFYNGSQTEGKVYKINRGDIAREYQPASFALVDEVYFPYAGNWSACIKAFDGEQFSQEFCSPAIGVSEGNPETDLPLQPIFLSPLGNNFPNPETFEVLVQTNLPCTGCTYSPNYNGDGTMEMVSPNLFRKILSASEGTQAISVFCTGANGESGSESLSFLVNSSNNSSAAGLNVTLYSPTENETIMSANVNFSYHVETSVSTSCFFNLNDNFISFVRIENASNISFVNSLADGEYNWFVTCRDVFLDEVNSSVRNFVVLARDQNQLSGDGGSSGSGGGGIAPNQPPVNLSCVSSWECYWEECKDGIKRRVCFDKNSCALNTTEVADCFDSSDNRSEGDSFTSTGGEFDSIYKNLLQKHRGMLIFVLTSVTILCLVIIFATFLSRRRYISLESFISECRKRGYSSDEIAGLLRSNGWADKEFLGRLKYN